MIGLAGPLRCHMFQFHFNVLIDSIPLNDLSHIFKHPIKKLQKIPIAHLLRSG